MAITCICKTFYDLKISYAIILKTQLQNVILYVETNQCILLNKSHFNEISARDLTRRRVKIFILNHNLQVHRV